MQGFGTGNPRHTVLLQSMKIENERVESVKTNRYQR